MFHIITSIVIVLCTLFLPTELTDQKKKIVWTTVPRLTYTTPSDLPAPIADYYDGVFGHIDNDHYYAGNYKDTAEKYENAKARIVGWKRAFGSLKIHHQALSTNYTKLENKYQGLKMDKKCSDFLRDYIPSIERDYIQHRQGFKSEFKNNNQLFAQAYYRLDNSVNKIYEVYLILKSNGLKFKERNLCSFQYMSDEEYNAPVPEFIEKWPNNERSNINKCEQWIFFLDAVKKETSETRSSDIQMWQLVMDNFEQLTNKPYPMLVQAILYAFYWSHQYHHRVSYEKADSTDGEKNSEKIISTSNPGEMMRCMFNGFVNWQTDKSITLFSQTTPWTTPKFQICLDGKKPTAKATKKFTVDPKRTIFPMYTKTKVQED